MAFGDIDSDDEALLELLRKRQEQAALREQSLASGNPLGRIIAGVAGGVEAGMRGESGSQGAMRGMEFVDQNQRRLAALQADRESKELAPLIQIAKLRQEKARQAAQEQAALNKLEIEHGYRTKEKEAERAWQESMLPRKEQLAQDRILSQYAAMGANAAQLERLRQSFQGEWKGKELEAKQGQFEASLADKAAEREAREKEKEAERAWREQQSKLLADLQRELQTMRDKGAMARTEKQGTIKAAMPKAQKEAKGAPVVPGYDVLPDAAPTDQDAKEVKKISSGINGANRAIDKLREYIKKGPGVRSLPGSQERAQLDSLAKSLVIDMKEAANLGALAGPDMDLVMGMIGDPTGAKAAWMGNEDYLKVLNQAQATINQKHADRVSAYGYAPRAGTLRNPPPPPIDKQAVINELRRRGLVK